MFGLQVGRRCLSSGLATTCQGSKGALSRWLSHGPPLPSVAPSEPSKQPAAPSPAGATADVEAETAAAAAPVAPAATATNLEGPAAAQHPRPRVALPHKATLVECRDYQEYLRQRWRFKTHRGDAADARAMYRLANCLEYQTVQALSLSATLQKIVTGAAVAQERYRQSGGDPKALEIMSVSIKRLIGIMQHFRRASRPTFEGLAQFRDDRLNRIKETRGCRAQQQRGRGSSDSPTSTDEAADTDSSGMT